MPSSVFSLLSMLVRRLPPGAADFLVERVLVRGLMLSSPGRRRVARANLARVLRHGGREPSDAELDALVERSLPLYARFILAMMTYPRELAFARERGELAALDAIRRLRAGGKGVVVATPNFGLAGHGVWALAQGDIPFHIPILRREFMSHMSAQDYARLETVGRSGRAMLRALARNEVVCTIVDINYLPHRRTTVFFGAPAPLGYAAARLSQVSGAPLLPVYAVDLGERYRVEADAPIAPAAGGRRRDLQELNDELARSMERYIARYPEQWLVYDDFWNIKAMDRTYGFVSRWAGG